MTAPSFVTAPYVQHYFRLKTRNAERDSTHARLYNVRQGRMKDLYPDELASGLDFEGVATANFIDGVAHDMGEGIAPLPSLACVSGRMETQADQKRAEIKNRIGDSFLRFSAMERAMYEVGDKYCTYGFAALAVEPDVDCKMPDIKWFDPRGSYYELDRKGKVIVFAHREMETVDNLCAQYPEYEAIIRSDPNDKLGQKQVPGDLKLEVVRWFDKTQVALFIPERRGLLLGMYQHKMSRCPVSVGLRPGNGDNPRGQFDDVVHVQVAKAIMASLALQAASDAVQSPTAIPMDVEQYSIGPNALIQTEHPEKIQKVAQNVPAAAFAEGQQLDAELRIGSRYPEARTGSVNASVITGKGVEALLGTFDSQIRGAQAIFKGMLQDIISMCFEMDETWWPHEQKTVSGTMSGASYEFKYTPAEAINGRWECTVTYGFASGMRPDQAIITMLQLEGAGLVAKGTTMQNLPFSIDPLVEQRRIDVEGSREALKQGLFAFMQSSGQMAAQGQDPTMIIELGMNFIKHLQNGDTVEDALDAAFQIQKQKAAEEAAEQQPPGGAPGAPGAPAGPGGPGDGLPQGVAPGQAGLPPGGAPTTAQMISGMRGDASSPVNSAVIKRVIPTGT